MPELVHHRGHWAPSKQQRRLPPHRNRGIELVLVEKGRLHWMVEEQPLQVEPGSVFFTLPWELHGGVEHVEPNADLWFAVLLLDQPYPRRPSGLRFHAALGLKRAETRQISSVLLGTRTRCLPATPLLRRLLPALVTELENPGDLHAAYVPGLVRLLLLELVRALRQPVRPAGQAAAERVRAFVQQLRTESARPWTLAEMAGRCGLRRSQFSDQFKTLTGDSPITHLNRLRVAAAIDQLTTTDRAITAIAHDCGFSSSQYFARVFKSFTGGDARSYRARREAFARARASRSVFSL